LNPELASEASDVELHRLSFEFCRYPPAEREEAGERKREAGERKREAGERKREAERVGSKEPESVQARDKGNPERALTKCTERDRDSDGGRYSIRSRV
jgi:hypothetical protein